MSLPERGSTGEDIAKAAASLIGTPFRLQGRDPRYGLDCIGLVEFSLSSAGYQVTAPRGYGLRQPDLRKVLRGANACGLIDARTAMRAGDIILVSPGPGQSHLLVCETSTSFIHAHAGLRKVARLDGELPWPVLRQWRTPSPE